jgi:hypothetical protein
MKFASKSLSVILSLLISPYIAVSGNLDDLKEFYLCKNNEGNHRWANVLDYQEWF